MKKSITLILLLFLGTACRDTTGPPQPTAHTKFVPDHTPYIEGLIQFTPDTTFHYPEVLVGYFTHTTNPNDTCTISESDGIHLRPKRYYPGLWSIMLTRQVAVTSVLFGLCWQPESQAVVTVRGPLGAPQEKQVTFTSKGNGVYGDTGYALPRTADGRYKLEVSLPDGRKYVSTTYIPEYVPIKGIKDSVRGNVYYKEFHNGAPYEQGLKAYKLLLTPPKNGFLSVFQRNSDRDRQIEVLKPNEKFRYSEYGPYLRDGSNYTIALTQTLRDIAPRDTMLLPWGQILAKPRNKVWNSQHFWQRASFFSEGIGGKFFVPFIVTSSNLDYDDGFGSVAERAALNKDTTFLHRASTILKVGPNGESLPKDSSDAIGFFAGEFSRYFYTTLFPDRQFNLDSVLTAWENRNK